jgi:hypothetical protein
MQISTERPNFKRWYNLGTYGRLTRVETALVLTCKVGDPRLYYLRTALRFAVVLEV